MMGAAAYRAGGALGQVLGQQPGLCIQKRPLQPVPLRVGIVLGGSGGTVGLLRCVGGFGLPLAVRHQPGAQLGQRRAALRQLFGAVM